MMGRQNWWAAAVFWVLVTNCLAEEAGPAPPAESVRDFAEWEKTGDYATGNRLRAVLKKKGPEGEALAVYILEAARKEKLRNDPMRLLWARAFTTGEDGTIKPYLDGPYLKDLARMSTPDDANHRYFRQPEAALAYLKLHPEDHELYWRLRLAATRDAKVETWPKSHLEEKLTDGAEASKKITAPEQPPALARNYGLRDAWEILLQLKVLRPGMPVEDAVRILGKPDRRDESSISWSYRTPRHANPLLSAGIEDERITTFRNGKG